MPRIDVRKIDENTFEVSVEDRTSTRHTVTVSPAYATAISPNVALERLIHASFEFLLERESNSSILRQFELPVIARYFPEYEREIRKMLPG